MQCVHLIGWVGLEMEKQVNVSKDEKRKQDERKEKKKYSPDLGAVKIHNLQRGTTEFWESTLQRIGFQINALQF